jgi:hypothetical protein
MQTAQQVLSVEDIEAAIYQEGSIPLLNKVSDALIKIGKHDPLAAHLSEQIQEVILWQSDFSENVESEYDAE